MDAFFLYSNYVTTVSLLSITIIIAAITDIMSMRL